MFGGIGSTEKKMQNYVVRMFSLWTMILNQNLPYR